MGVTVIDRFEMIDIPLPRPALRKDQKYRLEIPSNRVWHCHQEHLVLALLCVQLRLLRLILAQVRVSAEQVARWSNSLAIWLRRFSPKKLR